MAERNFSKVGHWSLQQHWHHCAGEDYVRQRMLLFQAHQLHPLGTKQVPESVTLRLSQLVGSRMKASLEKQTSGAIVGGEEHLQMLLSTSTTVLSCRAAILKAAQGTDGKVDSEWKASSPIAGQQH
jgi:hypothetical protein